MTSSRRPQILNHLFVKLSDVHLSVPAVRNLNNDRLTDVSTSGIDLDKKSLFFVFYYYRNINIFHVLFQSTSERRTYSLHFANEVHLFMFVSHRLSRLLLFRLVARTVKFKLGRRTAAC